MVLLILAVIWAAVLIPPALKSRADSSPVDSIGAFRQQLNVLQRTSPMAGTSPLHRIAPYAPMAAVPTRNPQQLSLAEARARRRSILFGLAAAVPVSLLGAVITGGIVWMMHLAVDAALAAYVLLLVRARNAAAEREMKVRFLPGPMPAAAGPELALRRSATN